MQILLYLPTSEIFSGFASRVLAPYNIYAFKTVMYYIIPSFHLQNI